MKHLEIALWVMSVVFFVLGIILKKKILLAIVFFGYGVYWIIFSVKEHGKRKKGKPKYQVEKLSIDISMKRGSLVEKSCPLFYCSSQSEVENYMRL